MHAYVADRWQPGDTVGQVLGDPVSTGRSSSGHGLCIRQRGLRDYTLWMNLSGACDLWVDGRWQRCVTASLVLFHPEVPQYYRPTDGAAWDVCWTVFRARSHWAAYLDWPGPTQGMGVLDIAETEAKRKIRDALLACHASAWAPLPAADDLAMAYLELAIVLAHDQRLSRVSREVGVPHAVRRVAQYVATHLIDPLSVDELARVSGLSAPQLTRVMRRSLGQSPREFIEQQRMERAASLLRWTPRRVEDVADEVGYGCPYYFSRRFARHFGEPPSTYRAGQRRHPPTEQ